eukprot:CAMPEP_0197418438 /NCGR_PEP_ID=MMETSP1170-20131217/4162_1 /TAXON_ID=54406 /ORGANISM="Sarcinochrysis sp, Strain CCMP770" /LENGTH=52 /DNA_ID=CAMNT_0042945477 /DNA_START=310 /DNA_END=468 /DNA_ORIENTATION=+
MISAVQDGCASGSCDYLHELGCDMLQGYDVMFAETFLSMTRNGVPDKKNLRI